MDLWACQATPGTTWSPLPHGDCDSYVEDGCVAHEDDDDGCDDEALHM